MVIHTLLLSMWKNKDDEEGTSSEAIMRALFEHCPLSFTLPLHIVRSPCSKDATGLLMKCFDWTIKLH